MRSGVTTTWGTGLSTILPALAVVLLAAAVLLMVVDPTASRLFPACPFRALTGLLCPGCGALRATHQLLTGHPIRAFQLNPLLFLLAPLALVDLAVALSPRRAGRRPALLASPVVGWGLPALVCAFWVLRNLPIGTPPA